MDPSDKTAWHPFDGGRTIGERGSESGIILLDEETDAGARITLERSGAVAPFSITCGVYGGLLHTRFFSKETEARGDYAAMRARLLILATSGSDAEWESGVRAFIADFP
jgi:hypothetical protein